MLDPLGQQRRLAVAGGRGQQRQRLRETIVQAGKETGALEHVRTQSGRSQLG